MKVINLDNVEKVAVDMEGVKGAFKQVPISKDDGAPVFCFRVFTLEADGHTPFHQHPFEHEIFVLEGEGVAEGPQGEISMRPGIGLYIPPDEPHGYRNTGADALRFICVVPHQPDE